MSLKLRPNRPRQKAGEELVPEHVAAAIGVFRLRGPGSRRPCRAARRAACRPSSARRRGRRSGRRRPSDTRRHRRRRTCAGRHCPCPAAARVLTIAPACGGDLACAVAAVVIVDVDRGVRQRGAEAGDRRARSRLPHCSRAGARRRLSWQRGVDCASGPARVETRAMPR